MAAAGSRSIESWGLPWPDGTVMPRWARDRRGHERRPRQQIQLVPHASVEHHIALYQGLLHQWVVVITRSNDDSHNTSTIPTGGAVVRTRSYLWPFGDKGYRATVRNHMYPRAPQIPAGLTVERRP